MTGAAARASGRAPLIDVRHDHLTLALQGVPWAVVFTELERQAGVTFRVEGPLEGTVTEAFDALPLEQGLRRLLRHANFLFLYAGAPHGQASGSRLVQVWIVPRDNGRAAQADITPPRHQVIQPAARAGQGSQASVVAGGTTAEQMETDEHGPEVLATAQAPRDPETLIRSLQDPDADVRESAVSDLANVKDAAAVEHLRRALVEDASAAVRGSAAEALAEIATAQAIEALRLALRDRASAVRGRAVEALGTIGEPQAIDALREALGDQDEDVRDAAAVALEQLTDEPSKD
jgi:HEAT repeats